MKSRTLFSWALKAEIIHYYARVFLTSGVPGESSVCIALCCEKPFLSLRPWVESACTRFHQQPEQLQARSTKGKGMAAGFCRPCILMYEPRVWADSLREGTREAFPLPGTFCFRGEPQDLTLHSDVAHPEELAGICHHRSSRIMGKKQRLCESQEPRHALCLHLSPWMLFLALATRWRVHERNRNPTCQHSWWPEQ